MTSIIVRSFQL